jgi:hypothetical protein
MIIGCRSRDNSGSGDIEDSGEHRGGFNDQSGWSLGGDALVRDSGVVDGSGVRKLEDKGDRFCGSGIDFGADRGPHVNPDGGEELNGMFKMGDLRNGKEEGVPLWVCISSASSRPTDLGIGTGAVGGVKPVDIEGFDKLRAEGRAPPGTPVALEKEELRRLPGMVFEEGCLLDREEAFELSRIAGVTEYITYMNASDVCFEWFHELPTSRDGIRDHTASIDS